MHHVMSRSGAAAGWRISSASRAVLCALVSRVRSAQAELGQEVSELADAVSVALGVPEGQELHDRHLQAIRGYASSGEHGLATALRDLLVALGDGKCGTCEVGTSERVPLPEPQVALDAVIDTADLDAGSVVWLEDVECPRCGVRVLRLPGGGFAPARE